MFGSKLLSVNTRRWVKRNKSIRSTTNYRKTQSIGIVFSIDDRNKHDIIKSFVKRLEVDGKQVDVLAFLPENKENHEFLFDFFTLKDISFWGNYHSKQVLNFAKKPFDYLLHIDFDNLNVINGLLALSKAKCRIGGAKVEQSKFYEMIITTPQKDIQTLVDEMYNYISILN